jgi:hypothetical protein
VGQIIRFGKIPFRIIGVLTSKGYNTMGMDQDEVLRLKQISGLTELFQQADFSPAWTVT